MSRFDHFIEKWLSFKKRRHFEKSSLIGLTEDQILELARLYGFECALKGVPLSDAISVATRKMSEIKINNASAHDLDLNQKIHSIKKAEDELLEINEYPEQAVENAIMNLPESDRREVSVIDAKLIEIRSKIKFIKEKLFLLKNNYHV